MSDGAGRVVISYLHPDVGVSGDFCQSLVDLLVWDMGHEQRIVNGGHVYGMQSGANIVTARNKVALDFLESYAAEWLMLIDSDMSFPPWALDALVAAADPTERPIMGGLCFALQTDEVDGRPLVAPTIYLWAEPSNDLDPVAVARATELPDVGVCQVGATGAAFLLIHRSALEAFAAQFPRPWPFFAERALPSGANMSEDIEFCYRAALLEIPVYVHLGVEVGHDKIVNVNRELFELQRSLTIEPEFVVVGTGRSGTGYISQLLTAAGIRTGHEQWWNPFDRHAAGLIGDASWLAVPHLEDYSGHVFHQTRDPLHTLRSLLNGDLFVAEGQERPAFAEPYWRYKAEHLEAELTGEPMIDAMRYVLEWNERAEKHSEERWRLESIDADTLVKVAKALGRPMGYQQARAALAQVPTTVNTHRRRDGLEWADLPDCPERAELAEQARRYGYNVQEV